MDQFGLEVVTVAMGTFENTVEFFLKYVQTGVTNLKQTLRENTEKLKRSKLSKDVSSMGSDKNYRTNTKDELKRSRLPNGSKQCTEN